MHVPVTDQWCDVRCEIGSAMSVPVAAPSRQRFVCGCAVLMHMFCEDGVLLVCLLSGFDCALVMSMLSDRKGVIWATLQGIIRQEG